MSQELNIKAFRLSKVRCETEIRLASEKERRTSARSRRNSALAVKSLAAAKWRPDHRKVNVSLSVQKCGMCSKRSKVNKDIFLLLFHQDMEFVTNITRIYVSRKSFTPKYRVNYNFLGQEENINLPLCYINIIYTHVYFYLAPSITFLDQKIQHQILQNSNKKRINDK